MIVKIKISVIRKTSHSQKCKTEFLRYVLLLKRGIVNPHQFSLQLFFNDETKYKRVYVIVRKVNGHTYHFAQMLQQEVQVF